MNFKLIAFLCLVSFTCSVKGNDLDEDDKILSGPGPNSNGPRPGIDDFDEGDHIPLDFEDGKLLNHIPGHVDDGEGMLKIMDGELVMKNDESDKRVYTLSADNEIVHVQSDEVTKLRPPLFFGPPPPFLFPPPPPPLFFGPPFPFPFPPFEEEKQAKSLNLDDAKGTKFDELLKIMSNEMMAKNNNHNEDVTRLLWPLIIPFIFSEAARTEKLNFNDVPQPRTTSDDLLKIMHLHSMMQPVNPLSMENEMWNRENAKVVNGELFINKNRDDQHELGYESFGSSSEFNFPSRFNNRGRFSDDSIPNDNKPKKLFTPTTGRVDSMGW